MPDLDIHNNDDKNLIHGTLFFTGALFSPEREKGKWKVKYALAYLYAICVSFDCSYYTDVFVFYPERSSGKKR